MTRTERNISKRAIIRDRSESKTGLDKSDRKGGAGAHNWGALTDEQDLEFRAREDNEEEDLSADEDQVELAQVVEQGQTPAHDGSLNERRNSGLSDEEWKQARTFRSRALKDGTDLGAIARTSGAVSTSPPGKSSTVRILQDADRCGLCGVVDVWEESLAAQPREE
ncbi:hypothetical protein Clacol_009070 [Clathrus columnatus]|uniref:Hyaluronan/mRNA-binding protein domain-containing protein n=1 Tax=Clathrus columnatus TaxID=1419009 RepID=A0AAV5AM65_9AGAM|nr:hypothetical protein Clacol_009070 [Clathrus columnatus]